MAITPHTKIRLPLYIKEEVKKRTDNMSQFIIEAIQEKLRKTPLTVYLGQDE